MSEMLRGAVIGSPVDHSLSPLLHREALKFLGVDGSYSRTEVAHDGLFRFFAESKDTFDYLSITMPLKEEALSLPVEVDALSTRIQSANTLYKRDGQWHLTSTDGSGLVAALKNAGYSAFRRVLVLGAGGTARAVVGSLDGIAQEIVVLGRTSTRREVLESAVLQSNFDYQRWHENPDFQEFDLVINTTPAGAADLLANSLAPEAASLFFDVIYKPWPTVLGARWADCGGVVINGVELLIYQGIHQLSLALNHEVDEGSLAAHLRPILNRAIA